MSVGFKRCTASQKDCEHLQMGCLKPVTYSTKARLEIVNGVNCFVGLKTLCVLLLKLGDQLGPKQH